MTDEHRNISLLKMLDPNDRGTAGGLFAPDGVKMMAACPEGRAERRHPVVRRPRQARRSARRAR